MPELYFEQFTLDNIAPACALFKELHGLGASKHIPFDEAFTRATIAARFDDSRWWGRLARDLDNTEYVGVFVGSVDMLMWTPRCIGMERIIYVRAGTRFRGGIAMRMLNDFVQWCYTEHNALFVESSDVASIDGEAYHLLHIRAGIHALRITIQPRTGVTVMSKGGGGEDPNKFAPRPLTLTDPVSGRTFTQETNPAVLEMQQRFGFAPGPSASDQLNSFISQRDAQTKADSATAEAKRVADAAAAETKFTTARDTALGNTRTAANQFFTNQGLDPARFSPLLETELQREVGNIKDLDPNPTGAFDPNIGQTILNQYTTAGRTKATSALNDLFSPTFSQDRFSNTAADPFINDILNEQFNPASASLTFARDRGQLSPQGFAAATDLLNTKRTGAESTVRGLANSALTTDRKTIDDLIGGARTTASGLTADQFDTFDPKSFRTQADTRINQELGALGGDIRNAVGQTKFVDLSELIGAGGQAQGPIQTAPGGAPGGFGGDPSDPSAALAEQARRNAAQRGLGSQGAF